LINRPSNRGEDLLRPNQCSIGTTSHQHYRPPHQPPGHDLVIDLTQGQAKLKCSPTAGSDNSMPEGRYCSPIRAINTPGTIFVEMVLLGQQMHDNWAEALEEALVCVMARNDVHTFLLATRASPAASSASTPT